jgi:hypothetical protein
MAVPLAQLCAAMLAAVFGWAAVAKALRVSSWLRALRRYSLSPLVRNLAAPAVPAAEAVVAALMIGGRLQAGASLALGLVAAFSLLLARLGATGERRVPCGCFGRVGERSLRLLLARNAALAALAAVVLVARPRGWPSWALRAPAGAELVPVALIVLGVALSAWTGLRAAEALRGRGRT